MSERALELRDEAARLIEDAARLRAEAVRLEREAAEACRPKMPEVSEGDNPVVYFVRYLSGREYGYAAMGWRVGKSVRWAVTGEETRRFNWTGLLSFIGEANWPSLVLMTGGDPLLPPGAEAGVAETMGSFGRVKSTDKVTPIRTDKLPDGWNSYAAGPYSC